MNKREQRDAHYFAVVTDPHKWWIQAKRLMSSARLMREHALKYFTGPPSEKTECESHLNAYFILASFALENAMKALVVRKQADIIRQQLSARKILPDVLHTHDLLDLARLSDIPVLKNEDELFLLCMTRYAVWAGRYPAPVNADKVEVPTSLLTSDKMVITHAYEEYDVCLSEMLFNFIEKRWTE